MRGNTGREKTNDREFRLCSRTSGNVLLPQVILLLCIYTRILVPRGIVACMLSLLSMLTSGSHKDLPDCICHLFTMLYLFNSLLSFIPFIHFHSFLSFLPLYLKICVCLIQFVLSSFFYPVYSCLYREISCRSPRAFSTQAFTSTCTHYPGPGIQTLDTPHPLQRMSLGPQGRFLGQYIDTTIQGSL